MTVKEAIDRANAARQNQLADSLKLGWLSELDGRIRLELMQACEGEVPDFSGYDADTDQAHTALLISHPYDGLYVQYLVMRIDLENGELARYNADAQCFNRDYGAFAARYARTHRPLGVSALRF